MITLFAALALTAAPAAHPSLGDILFGRPSDARTAGSCVDRVTPVSAPTRPVQFSELGQLPDAHMELPVARYVSHNGVCRPAPLIVRNDVSR